MKPLERLLELYRELDGELAELQKACRACGRCCDFSTHGEVLYASKLEREVLAAVEVNLSPEPKVCPHLAGGRCTAREVRPLGCRTYFCEEPAASRGRELYERYRARVAAISRESGLEWDYRPVLEDEVPGCGS